jgi:dTMP kinase
VFISFEGGDGSGKSTQAQKLAQYFRDSGRDVLLTREPGGTALGAKLRDLLQGLSLEITPQAELLLYAADRTQHVKEVIRPALEAGKVVICDRYCDATVAYQGYGRKMDLELIQRINEWVTQGILPRLTLLLDIEPEIGLGRIVGSRKPLDRLEREKAEFHQRVRDGYLKLAAQQSHRFKIIPAEGDISTVGSYILEQVKPLLKG